MRTQMHTIRGNLGVCPQHDVLFADLSVEEHLYMFAALKGVPKTSIPAEIDKTLQAVDLLLKRSTHTVALSGGMKRKLSVGIALIGGSEVIFLDEPSSGME